MIFAFPFDSFTGGVAVTRTGFSLYREITATAVVAKSFGGVVSAGCNINYDHLAIARYGSTYTFGIDVGASVQLTDDVRWGFSLLNVNRPTIGREKDELPQLYLTGVSCQVLPTASVSCTLIKDVQISSIGPYRASGSLRWSSSTCALAFSSDPSRYCAGFGIHYLSMSVDYSVVTHVELGLTHTIGISINL